MTILIGISYKQKAELGVIGIPYKLNNGQCTYNPSILFGSVT